MLRRLGLALLAVTVLAWPAAAGTAADLARVLRLVEVFDVMREEGIDHGEELDRDMLDGTGGPFWAREVTRIYDTDRMVSRMTEAFAADMSPEEINRTISFFETQVGQQILTLETAARRAMSDPAVEEVARATYADLAGSDDTHLAATRRFVEVNDLVERNVAGAMSASLSFYQGLADGGALEMDDAMMLADIWGREQEIRENTEAWLYGFLLMAYRPLEPEALEDYIAFSGTSSGQALNRALFEGFDRMFGSISYDMGLGVGRAMMASEL